MSFSQHIFSYFSVCFQCFFLLGTVLPLPFLFFPSFLVLLLGDCRLSYEQNYLLLIFSSPGGCFFLFSFPVNFTLCLEHRSNYMVCFLGEMRNWGFVNGEMSGRLWASLLWENGCSVFHTLVFYWKKHCLLATHGQEGNLVAASQSRGMGAPCSSTLQSGLPL